MKAIVLLSLISLISLASSQNLLFQNYFKYCNYNDASTGVGYYFYSLGYNNWLNATDSNGNMWSFQVCNYANDYSDSDFVAPCQDGTSVCVVRKDGMHDMGDSSTVSFSSIVDNTGFEVMYGNSNDDTIKTVIDVVCTPDAFDPIITIVSDDSFTTITVNSTYGCPQNIDLDVDIEDDDEEIEYSVDIGGFLFFVMMVVLGLLCTVCCCCCLVRRRRCQRNKSIAMKQFSNVAFQPIPSGRGVQQPTTTPLPTYNPYLTQQQPQFVYYYPSQPQTVVPLQPMNQVNDDEKLAKQLQAQFDQESRV